MNSYEKILENTRAINPLVHFITNYVTANDCANITLAAGGSPIMADELQETESIASLCSALILNIGTINLSTITSMLTAGKQANKLHKPIILDPVGVGSSEFRNNTVKTLMKELDFAVIKGNISEIKFLYEGITSIKGVDADEKDYITEDNLKYASELGKKLSMVVGCTVVITGPIDIVATNKEAYAIRNGHDFMSKVTGTGCMCGAVIGCYAAANPKDLLSSAIAGVSSMGICGEQAYKRLNETDAGIGTFHLLLTDFMGKLNAETFNKYNKIERLTF